MSPGVLQRRSRPSLALGVAVMALCLAVETLVAALLSEIPRMQSLDMLYLLGVVVVASGWGLWLGATMAVVSTAVYDYFFVSPTRTFRVADLAVIGIFLVIALLASVLASVLSSLATSLAVEAEAHQEADLGAELARLLLRAPDLNTALPTAARHLARALGLPSASIELGAIAGDERREAFLLGDNGRLGTLLVPAGLAEPTRRRLWDWLVPTLEVLLQAARERQGITDALKASRARVVATSDETRQRVERDLHDGLQQRLITVGLQMRGVEADLPPELDQLKQQLSRTARDLGDAVADLHEISRGLHPAILAKGGLQPALANLARRSAVPVELDVRLGGRLPDRVEITAYYIVSEALTNAAEHAHASLVHIEATTTDALLRLRIRDDGIGDADPSRGSGLTELTDRVESLNGTIEITSPPGGGTTLLIQIPSSGPGPW
ncbi:MAG: DUF4118 domain-containing protein [Actinoallomurus sp.]